MSDIKPLQVVNKEDDYEISVIIRQAEISDARAILNLLCEANQETDFLLVKPKELSLQDEEDIIERFQYAEKSILLVVEVDGQIVGLGNLASYGRGHQDHIAQIGLVIISEYWGFGLGKLLVGDLLDFAKSVGLVKITLEVMESNIRAISLYKSYGFNEIGKLSKHVRKDHSYFDAYLMELLL
ncbi:GNAT family N-acetyltransferase [Hutsoniella sourekii]|uniref:GNAT family N-acetyltransferase n=1 Tax=Hutsoniella sourekii TaxID=87650 RepID=UPI0004B4FA88|nr:GNAT family N-acetyltransferase [Hutsoniella sourekii]